MMCKHEIQISNLKWIKGYRSAMLHLVMMGKARLPASALQYCLHKNKKPFSDERGFFADVGSTKDTNITLHQAFTL